VIRCIACAAVSKALIEMGPDCEAKVTPLLELRSGHAIRGALQILDKIATSSSLPALEKAVKTIQDRGLVSRAKGVIESVKERESDKK
jgi:hypothetical protein